MIQFLCIIALDNSFGKSTTAHGEKWIGKGLSTRTQRVKTTLAETFGKTMGKATVTGYCIRFKSIKDIDLDVLQAAMRYGFESQNQ